MQEKPGAFRASTGFLPPALIGAGVIIVEVVGDRLITISSGLMFFFLAITTALTGIAAGYAIGIKFFSGRQSGSESSFLPMAVLGSSLMISLGFCGMPIGDSGLLLVLRLLMLACAALGLFLFNACSGLLLYLIYSQGKSRPSRILFSDMMGASCGLLILALIGIYLPYNMLLAVGMILVLWAAARTIKPVRHAPLAAAFMLLILIGLPNRLLQPVPVENRRGFHTMSMHRENARFSCLWSDVALFSGHDGRDGVMLFDGGNHSSRIPPMLYNKVNGANAPSPDPLLTACIRSQPPEKALVIGSAGGLEVLCLKSENSRHIDAINQDPMVFESLDSEFGRDLTRVYDLPGVYASLAEGRRFVRAHTGSYDAIVVREANPDAGALHAAGAIAVSTLATTEGLSDLLSGLNEDGILIVETNLGVFWYRIFSTHWKEQWRDHVMTLSNGYSMAHIVSNQPFSAKKRLDLQKIAGEFAGIDIVSGKDTAGQSPFMKNILDSGGVPGYQASTDERPYYVLLRPWFSRGFSLEGAPARILSDPLFAFPVSPVHLLLAGFCIFGLWIGIHTYAISRRKTTDQGIALPRLLFAFAGGMGFCFYEISLVRISYQMAGSILHAWSVSLLACLLGASLSALMAPRLTKQSVFLCLGIGGLLLLGGMKLLLARSLATFPWDNSMLSDTVLFVTYIPMAFFLALPLSLLTVVEKDRRTALPAIFIANALGALIAAPLSLLVSITWGHGGTIIFVLCWVIVLLFLRSNQKTLAEF